MPSHNPSILIDVGQGISLLTGLLRLNYWVTPNRPKNPRRGTFGFNSQTNSLEYFNGKYWLEASMRKV